MVVVVVGGLAGEGGVVSREKNYEIARSNF